MGCLDLRLGPCLDVGIDWRRNVVDLINRSGLGFLLRRRIVRLQSREGRAVHALKDALQFVLYPLVRANLRRALQQHVHGVIEVAFGCFQIAGLEFLLASLALSLGFRDQVGNRVRSRLNYGLGFGRCNRLWIRCRLGSRYRSAGSHRRSVGLRSGQLCLILIRVAGCSGQYQGQGGRRQQLELLDPHVYLLLTLCRTNLSLPSVQPFAGCGLQRS